MRIQKNSTIATLVLAVPLLLGTLTACNSSGNDSHAGSGGSQTPSANTRTFDSFEEYQLAFSKCMRGKGIDMGDPKNGGQSLTQADDAFAAAAKACQSEIGKPPARGGDSSTTGNGAESSSVRKEHLRIAACLREHGVDVPDPAPGKDLDIPTDVPVDALETCAPNGVVGAATGGN